MSQHLYGFKIPEVYWVKVEDRRCTECSERFEYRSASGDYMVKFVEEGGIEERWLPTYGEGGYLHLLQRLVPGFASSEEITEDISRTFENAFVRHQTKSKRGNVFIICRGVTCPQCGSRSANVLGERVETAPPVVWLSYSLSH